MIPEYDEIPIDNYEQDVELEEETSLTFRLEEDRKRIFGMIDELEAIRQAIYCILHTERYQYEMYSEDYGTELEDLIGQPMPLVYVNLRDSIQDALLTDQRILAVDNFSFEENGHGAVHVSFDVETELGDLQIEQEVLIGG